MPSPAGNDGVGRWNELHEGTGANVRFAGPDKKTLYIRKRRASWAPARCSRCRCCRRVSGDERNSAKLKLEKEQ